MNVHAQCSESFGTVTQSRREVLTFYPFSIIITALADVLQPMPEANVIDYGFLYQSSVGKFRFDWLRIDEIKI